MASNKRRNTAISMGQKLEILHQLDNQIPVRAIASEYQIAATTVRRIRKNANTIKQAAEGKPHTHKLMRIRKATYDNLEHALYQWFVERRTLGDPISDLILRQKAQVLMNELEGHTTFRGSVGLLMKFKNRYGIHLAKLHGEKGSADAAAAEEFKVNFTLQIQEEGIEHDNIYNMDESGLMWKALPSKTLVQNKEKNDSGAKVKKDRVSVGFCANMTGTHKLTPLFIHKYKKPRPLKNIMKKLPVVYKTQKRAWMDQTVFTDWFENHFKPSVKKFQLESRTTGKVILLLDNCAGHKLTPGAYVDDGQFQIVFLAPNTTSIIQPMDQGVISKVKQVFRHRMLTRVVSSPGNIQEFYDKYNLRDCIYILEEAWKEITASNIQNSWNSLMNTAREGTAEEECPTDSIEPQLEEIIAAITGENINDHSVGEYLRSCNEAEICGEENEGEEESEAEVETMESHEEENGGEASTGGEEEDEEDIRARRILKALRVLKRECEEAPRHVQRSLKNVGEHFFREGP